MEKKKIIIVEDEALIAVDIMESLEDLGYNVIGHAANGDNALDLFANNNPDLIILDIHIKGTLSGIDLARIIRQKYKIPFIFLTSFSDKLTLEEVKTTIPYGYIVKPFNENDLRSNIELALFKFESENNSISISKEAVETKFKIHITNREYEVLMCIFTGCPYKKIAKDLFISINTVKTYQKKLFNLLEVNSRHQLVAKLK